MGTTTHSRTSPDVNAAAAAFVEKWARTELSERAASHEHFLDLCRLLDQPTPATADATGEDYCFEKHVKVVRSASIRSKGEHGFVDVWWRGKFAWEYKQKGNIVAGTPRVFNELLETIAPHLVPELREATVGQV